MQTCALPIYLERGGEVEDHLAVLAHDDAAVREAAPVEIALDAKMQRLGLVAAAQEIGVERMDLLAGINGARRGDNRLRDHLSAADAVARRGRPRGQGEQIGRASGRERE